MSRSVRAAALLLALGLAVGLVALASSPAAGVDGAPTATANNTTVGWPGFGYDAANTGSPPDTRGPASGVVELWNVSVGDPIEESVAVSNGTVYVGSYDHNLYAFDAETGEERWRFTTESAVSSAPAAVDGTVFFTSPSGSQHRGTLHALDASTGAERWNFTVRGIEWSTTVGDGTIYLASDTGRVYALNASTGAARWSASLEYRSRVAPAVVNGTVYVTAGTMVYALDASTGAETWSRDSSGRTTRTGPAVVDGTVYVGVSGPDGVYATDSAGAGWAFGTNDVVRSTPSVADGVVYAGSDDGTLYALDADTGTRLWSYATGAEVRGSPAIADGVVYVGNDDGTLYALNATSGAVLWNERIGSSSLVSPVVVDGTIYVANRNGTLYALHEPANVRLAVTGTNSPVTKGDALDVSVSIENVGGVPATGTAELLVNGTSVDADAVTVPARATTTHTLSWDAATGDAGSYTATVRFGNDTATRTVVVEPANASTPGGNDTTTTPSNGGSAGGGGGGASANPTISQALAERTPDGVAVEVINGQPSTPARTLLAGASAGGVTYDQLTIQFAEPAGDFRVEFRLADLSVDAPTPDARETITYFRVTGGPPDGAIATAKISFSLPPDALPAGASPADVTVLRYHDGEWQQLDTERVGDEYTARSPGFSTFAVVVTREHTTTSTTRSPTTETSRTTTRSRTATTTATATTEATVTAGQPGFGVGAALAALLVAVSLAWRRTS